LPNGAANQDLRGANLDLSKDLSPIQDAERHSDSQLAHQVPPGGSNQQIDLNIGNSSFYTALNPVNSSNPMSVGPLSDNTRHSQVGAPAAPYQKFLSINSSSKKTQQALKNQRVKETNNINQQHPDDLRGWTQQDLK
jgi:hypothetical protein